MVGLVFVQVFFFRRRQWEQDFHTSGWKKRRSIKIARPPCLSLKAEMSHLAGAKEPQNRQPRGKMLFPNVVLIFDP